MPWPIYANMTNHDLRAVYEFLRAIRPRSPDVLGPGRSRAVGFRFSSDLKTKGPFAPRGADGPSLFDTFLRSYWRHVSVPVIEGCTEQW
jgi:hypothetical protein